MSVYIRLIKIIGMKNVRIISAITRTVGILNSSLNIMPATIVTKNKTPANSEVIAQEKIKIVAGPIAPCASWIGVLF